jgi:hypothetical protein
MQDFDKQIERLKSAFGERPFDPERIKIIWREVGHFPPDWFRMTVDEFLSHRGPNQPPLPADFANVVSQQREFEWQREKSKNASSAEQFWTEAPRGFFDSIFKQFKKEE